MIRRAITWLRVVAPRPAVCGVVLFVYALSVLILGVARWYVGVPIPEAEGAVFCLTMITCLCYAVYRGNNFHPLFNADYLQWLQTTPWRAGKPLPKGPIHLVPQDLVVWSFLCLPLLWHESSQIYSGPKIAGLAEVGIVKKISLCATLSLLVYLLPITVALRAAGRSLFAYVLALSGVIAVRCIPYAGWNLVLAAGCYAIGWLGLSRSLNDYPWDNLTLADRLRAASGAFPDTPGGLGWPFQVAIEQPGSINTGPRWEPFALSLLVGWSAFVLSNWVFHSSVIREISLPEFRQYFGLNSVLVISFPAILLAVVRIATYVEGTHPPLSLLGRIVHGRWIIPKYDQVFLAPMAIAFSWALGSVMLVATAAPIEIVIGATFALVMLIALICPPSLRVWRLTGQFRSAPSLAIKKDAVEA